MTFGQFVRITVQNFRMLFTGAPGNGDDAQRRELARQLEAGVDMSQRTPDAASSDRNEPMREDEAPEQDTAEDVAQQETPRRETSSDITPGDAPIVADAPAPEETQPDELPAHALPADKAPADEVSVPVNVGARAPVAQEHRSEHGPSRHTAVDEPHIDAPKDASVDVDAPVDPDVPARAVETETALDADPAPETHPDAEAQAHTNEAQLGGSDREYTQGALDLDEDPLPPEIQFEAHGKVLGLTVALEALLFVSDAPVDAGQFAKALGLSHEQIQLGLARLSLLYRRDGRGLRLMNRDGRYQLVTMPEAAGVIEDYLNLDLTTRLSGPALETLAVIAYRQPVTRAQVEAVRGVDCSGVMRSLLQRGLIEDAGRLESVGRPILYSVTDLFMQHFGLTGMNELPELKSEEADTLWATTELAFEGEQPLGEEEILEGEEANEPTEEEPSALAPPAQDEAEEQPPDV